MGSYAGNEALGAQWGRTLQRALEAEQQRDAALARVATLEELLREARTHVLDHLDCMRGTPLADDVDATLCGISVALAQTGAE